MTDKPHVLITGANRGIGAAIASRFAQSGARLSLISRNFDLLKERVSEMETLFSQSQYQSFALDVAKPEAVKEVFTKAVAAFGPVQVLVNNAGCAESVPFVRADSDHWNKMIAINLSGVYHCTRETLPGMIEARFGRIINIASTAGLSGYSYIAAYCAAKHGVVGLTRALALEVAGSGVTVNAVCPGYTDTDLLREGIRNAADKSQRPTSEIEAAFLANVPQGRFVQPDEVASAVEWIAKPEQGSFTGQTLTIAGGEKVY